MSSESITTTRRAHLRSDGPAENPYGIRTNSWGVKTEDQGSQNEESFAGSEDRDGKTRLQHGSPAGTKDQENQDDSGDEEAMEEGSKTGSKGDAGSSPPEQGSERPKRNRGSLRDRSGSDKRRTRESATRVRYRRGRDWSLKEGSERERYWGDRHRYRDRLGSDKGSTTERGPFGFGGDEDSSPRSLRGGRNSADERRRRQRQDRLASHRGSITESRDRVGRDRGTTTERGQTDFVEDEESSSRSLKGNGLEVLLEQLVRLKESLATVQGEVRELLSTVLTRLQSTPLRKGDERKGHGRSFQRRSKEPRVGGYEQSREVSRSPSRERGLEVRRTHRKKKTRKKRLKVQFEESSSDSLEGSIPISREKHLEAVRKVPALANRKSPLKWLLAYKRYARSRKWAEADYCHMLPLVWGNQLGVVTENWFEGLSKRRRSTPLKLEQAFVRKFAQEDTEHFIQEIMHSVQGEGELCEDWFIKVYKQFKQMCEWVPKDMPTEERFIRVMVTRFTDRYMLVSLNDAQGLDETESSTDEGGSRPVLSATKIRHICKKADRLRRRLRRLGAEGFKRHKRFNQSRGGSLVDGMAANPTGMYAEGGEDLERANELCAGNGVHDLGEITSVRSVGGALTKLDMPTSGQIKREEDLQDFRNVVGRLHEPDHKNQICGFHACTLRGCNMGNRCAHAHEDRVNVKCEFYASPLQCPHGIFCRRRHLNEEYGVWLRDGANSSSYRFAIWQDKKSRFRRQPQE